MFRYDAPCIVRQNNPVFDLVCIAVTILLLNFQFVFLLLSCSLLALIHHLLTLPLSLQLCAFIQLSLALIRFHLALWLHGTRLGPALELLPALVLVVPAALLALLPAHQGLSMTTPSPSENPPPFAL